MTGPIVKISQVGGLGSYLTLLEFDVIGVRTTINRPDPYSHEFIGTWQGLRFAVVESAGSRLVRFINFFPVWNLTSLNLELIVSPVNLNGSSAGQSIRQHLNVVGSTLQFNSATEVGLSYVATRLA